ncbi:DAK2 domain-containing protein [Streptomyces sp. AM 3-1-1]|uniref:DAK2 domain-containing protein n=1 Tax=Streptomyces sp. AM 3-1-1 TaxID=3028711 RepID=UPI0023B940A7|nr:DAK2 domain-containing protein [Streptomyces sp. AM 3-1-1]WEH31807.1 DAK2 domain-containing protein [Streptomyces sp. AM 3-1-1]
MAWTGPEPDADGWMRRFAASARATEAELTALDQRVGDGDFGTNLSAGVGAALRRADAAPGTDTLEHFAEAFLDEVGGTSGPLFGLLLQAMAGAVGEGGWTVVALADGVGEGLAAIRRVGGAAPGDKTLVDALHPAAESLRGSAADPAGTPGSALAAAAEAGWAGVHRTAGLRARMGRSSYLGDRATGVPDPGAVGVALFFASAGGEVRELAPHLSASGV